MTTAAVPLGSAPIVDRGVGVAIPYPTKSSRVLMLVRGVLIAPHWIVLFLRILGAGFLTLIVNFFVVLIAGRPAAATWLTGVLRYRLRLQAYVWYMTDQYPPFSKSEGDYPVQIEFAQDIKIHRLRPIYTRFVTTPHSFISVLLYFGAAFVILWTALAILFTGRYPEGAFNYLSKVFAWSAKLSAYNYYLSAEYPPIWI